MWPYSQCSSYIHFFVLTLHSCTLDFKWKKIDYVFKVRTFSFNLRVLTTTSDEKCRSCSPIIVLLCCPETGGNMFLKKGAAGPTVITQYRCEHPQNLKLESCFISNPMCWMEFRVKKNRKFVIVQILMDCIAHHFPKIHPDTFIFLTNFWMFSGI